MAEDRVTITADAAQYFDVMRQASERAEHFDGSLRKVGGGLENLRLKSEGRVARNIAGLVQDFTSGASEGDLFAQAILRVGESFRGSLLLAGGAAAGIVFFK